MGFPSVPSRWAMVRAGWFLVALAPLFACGGETEKEAPLGDTGDEGCGPAGCIGGTSTGGSVNTYATGGAPVEEDSTGGAPFSSGLDPTCSWWNEAAQSAVACAGQLEHEPAGGGAGGAGGSTTSVDFDVLLFTTPEDEALAQLSYDFRCANPDLGEGYIDGDRVSASSDGGFSITTRTASQPCDSEGEVSASVISASGEAVEVPTNHPWSHAQTTTIVLTVTPSAAGQVIRFEVE